MSLNNIIPDCIIQGMLDKIRKEPKQLHFHLDLFPPLFSIDENSLTSCNEAFTWIGPGGGGRSGTISKSVDHPAFAALRKHLNHHGFIKMETGWSNGDVVTKPFYLNEVYFDVGEKFVCASAMSYHIKSRKRNYDSKA
jgi:hypothetical protein